jgi:hypothetical protein
MPSASHNNVWSGVTTKTNKRIFGEADEWKAHGGLWAAKVEHLNIKWLWTIVLKIPF